MSDDRRLMKCQLQAFTILDAQDVFKCFVESKDPQVDENPDDQQ